MELNVREYVAISVQKFIVNYDDLLTRFILRAIDMSFVYHQFNELRKPTY